ncbi:MAG TPA: hypothetical protein VGE40_13355, partial [Bacilli bacterium]
MKKIVAGIAVGFAIFTFMAAYTSGLFFDGDFYRFHILLYAVTFAAIMYLMIQKKAVFPSGIWLPFIMCLVYILPLWLSAASIKGTMEQIMRWTSYGCFLLLIYHYARERLRRQFLHYAFQGIGLLIVFAAFGGLYGLIDFKDIVQYMKDERLSILGLRLAGFFQYANTFAVVIAAFLLYHLMVLIKESGKTSRNGALQNGVSLAFAAFPLVAYGTALLLTESRGAWLMLGVAWVLGLFLIKWRQQVDYILLSIVTGAASLLVYRNLVSELRGTET